MLRKEYGESNETFSSSIVRMIHGSKLVADAKEDASGSPQAQASHESVEAGVLQQNTGQCPQDSAAIQGS